MAFAQAYAAKLPIHFIVARNERGWWCHYFVRCESHKLKKLKQPGGLADLATLGEVLASGFGKTPEKNLLQKLKDEFNYRFTPQ